MKSTFSLAISQDFNYPKTLDYLNRSDKELLYSVSGESIFKHIFIEENPYFFQIDPEENHSFAVSILNHNQDLQLESPISAHISEWLDLERNLDPFYQLAKKDELMAPLLVHFKGLRIIGVHDLFEALCWSILGQQVNLAFAYTLKKRVVENYGVHHEWEGRDFWSFPTPERIAKCTVEELRALSITNRKSEYMIGVAKLMVSGELSKDGLVALNDWKKAEKVLVSIRGIGPWAAHYVLMRCLRFTNAYPVADIGLKNAVRARLAMDRKPTNDELFTLAEGWKGWESYATFYLWQSLGL